MPRKDEKRLRVGVLGCGPIAQAAHFECCAKARNADLYAICDVADDLRERMACDPRRLRRPMPTTTRCWPIPSVDAVVIATPTPSMSPASIRRWRPASMCSARSRSASRVEEVEGSRRGGREQSGKVLQVGHMKRFDRRASQAAKAFIDDEMGEMLALKAWYCDRRTATR